MCNNVSRAWWEGGGRGQGGLKILTLLCRRPCGCGSEKYREGEAGPLSQVLTSCSHSAPHNAPAAGTKGTVFLILLLLLTA